MSDKEIESENEVTEMNAEKTEKIKDESSSNINDDSELTTNKNTDKISDEKDEYAEETKKNESTEKITYFYETDKIKKTEIEGTQNCIIEEILNNKCQNERVVDEQMEELNEQVKEKYLKEEYKNQNNIIVTENVLFQVTTLDNQTSSIFTDISTIDLGDCQDKLKSHYNIPEEETLIIFKTEIKTSDLSHSYIQYEIYSPLNLERLNLSFCDDSKITISSKVILDNATISLYNSLLESGYNLFNKSDSFYSDICCTYTSQYGTDITLADRDSELYNNSRNITLCQIGCELKEFNSQTKFVKCDCYPQISEIEAVFSSSNEKFILKMVEDSIFTTIKNSNLLVLKCYKLALDISTLLKNYGRIFMSIIIFIFLIFFFF